MEFPRGDPAQPEPPAPDILFQAEHLGIEITRYFQGQGKEGSPLRELESIQESIVNDAKMRFDSMDEKGFINVTVFWVSRAKPNKDERNKLVEGIVQIVTEWFIDHAHWTPDWKRPDEKVLQNHLGAVWIDRLHLGPSFWGCAGAGSIGDTINGVQKVLNEKEVNVAKYRASCRNVWLLIVAEGQHISSWFCPHEDLHRASFRTSFDRVFALDVFKCQVCEFHLESTGSGNAQFT